MFVLRLYFSYYVSPWLGISQGFLLSQCQSTCLPFCALFSFLEDSITYPGGSAWGKPAFRKKTFDALTGLGSALNVLAKSQRLF